MRLCGVFAVVLCAAATSFGAVSFDPGNGTNGVLTYGTPSDLGTGADIDPVGMADVTDSFGISKADFQAKSNVQVIGFNDNVQNPQVANLRQIVAQYNATGTVTITFPVVFNFGGRTSAGRSAFSGSSPIDNIATDTIMGGDRQVANWLEASIASTGGQGVQALGFCAALRNNQPVQAGEALFTLSDGSTAAVALPALGNNTGETTNPQFVWIGYEAPAGKTIVGVQASHIDLTVEGSGPGGSYAAIDDISFVMTAVPEPATLSLLALSGLMMIRRRHA